MTAPSPDAVVDTATLRQLVAALPHLSARDDADRIDQLRLLEELKCAAAGAQARTTVAFADSQCASQKAAGEPAHRVGTGVAGQVALARRESSVQGSRHLSLAKALVEMPHTAAALSRGAVTEWRATLVARETACLSRADRGVVDAELAARPGSLESLGDRAVEQETRRISYRLDPYAFTRRAAKAESDRHVTIRPAPDTMALVTGLLPMRQGVAVYAALTRHADSLRSEGDGRSRGQIMADTLVERITGQASAPDVPLEVHLVMTDAAFLGKDATPAQVEGFGPVPAPFARHWLGDSDAAVFVRRLYTAPTTHALVAMDSTRRTFTGGLRMFIGLRDQTCRTPWCDAPIRHLDHPRRVADGGQTTAVNGQGLCEACNQAKEAKGWRADPCDLQDRLGDPGGTIETVTPTGHRYLSRPPPLTPVIRSRMDLHFQNLILAA